MTDRGRLRRQNEDALLVARDLGLFVVADGMGGENAGEVASSVAVESIRAFIERSARTADPAWPFGVDAQLSTRGNRLRTAVKLANQTVHEESRHGPQYAGMGTTIVAALVDGASMAICSVGDSRAYSIKDGTAVRLTRDQTWVESLLGRDPNIDQEALARHPMRHVLTSAVGPERDLDPTIIERTLVDGERLLLCTDGVHKAIGDDRIAALVQSAPDPVTAAEQVVAAALAADGSDNITALVLVYVSGG
jgi:serine/threonine protein phosphatase PrpC